MSLAAIVGSIVAALKSFPALAQLVNRFIDEWKAYDIRKREADAAARLARKDSSVDSAIDNRGLSGTESAVREQPKTDESQRLAGGA
jgi:hypothetical protein